MEIYWHFLSFSAYIASLEGLLYLNKKNLLSKSTISTWKIVSIHVKNEDSPRGRETFPPKFHLILPKFHFVPTWIFSNSFLEIWKCPRGDWPFLPKKHLTAGATRDIVRLNSIDLPQILSNESVTTNLFSTFVTQVAPTALPAL